MNAPSAPVVEVTEERVKEALTRLQADIDKGGETEHLKIALFGLSSYLQFCKILSSPKATIHALRKLLGIPTPEIKPPPSKEKYDLLFVHAAQGWLFYSDDTGIKILALRAEVKIQRKTQKEVVRTGVHTSCIISELAGGGRIILFKSGIIHAGEFLDEVLAFGKPGLPPPLHMSDGSSCNPATVTKTIPAACNSHSKRKLDEKQDLFPEHHAFVKSIYKQVYKNDKHTKKDKMDPKERLAYHQEHSLPLMEKMFQWMQAEMDNKNVEPNSILGGIFNYFLERQDKLMAFTKYEGAPLDNNTLEQALKLIALLRKNAMFFKTIAGAKNGDVIMSLGTTAGFHGVNIDHYFTSCLRYQKEVQANPEAFLPWNYLKTVEELNRKALLNYPTVKELTSEQWTERQERFAKSKIRPFPVAPPRDIRSTAPTPEKSARTG